MNGWKLVIARGTTANFFWNGQCTTPQWIPHRNRYAWAHTPPLQLFYSYLIIYLLFWVLCFIDGKRWKSKWTHERFVRLNKRYKRTSDRCKQMSGEEWAHEPADHYHKLDWTTVRGKALFTSKSVLEESNQQMVSVAERFERPQFG